ncbi:hypothetical protein BV25DRAFT_775931 [Artomyces pyxidatus]|uniref:Uncharacterized protein n=1 Tax=Artomyces pyxidatus TaxID=48021 RepID=A0ACB8T005_9AGAM|nr:hypothetical protein BV25DRAFT_775931 [Artomyces pyxidatus]
MAPITALSPWRSPRSGHDLSVPCRYPAAAAACLSVFAGCRVVHGDRGSFDSTSLTSPVQFPIPDFRKAFLLLAKSLFTRARTKAYVLRMPCALCRSVCSSTVRPRVRLAWHRLFQLPGNLADYRLRLVYTALLQYAAAVMILVIRQVSCAAAVHPAHHYLQPSLDIVGPGRLRIQRPNIETMHSVIEPLVINFNPSWEFFGFSSFSRAIHVSVTWSLTVMGT